VILTPSGRPELTGSEPVLQLPVNADFFDQATGDWDRVRLYNALVSKVGPGDGACIPASNRDAYRIDSHMVRVWPRKVHDAESAAADAAALQRAKVAMAKMIAMADRYR
jgi:hypothetical protein